MMTVGLYKWGSCSGSKKKTKHLKNTEKNNLNKKNQDAIVSATAMGRMHER